jgi:serralysin
MTTISDPHGYASAKGWLALNDAYNTDGLVYGTDYQIAMTFGVSSFEGIDFDWSFPANEGGRVRAYPDIVFGAQPWGRADSDPNHVFPIQVKNLFALTANYNLAWSGDTGGFDVSYDIWFTSIPNGGPSTITNEVMIWLHSGNVATYGQPIGRYQDGSFSGTIYHSGTYTAIVADTDTSAGQIDIANVIESLEHYDIIGPTEYLTSIDLGAEAVQGKGSLIINQAGLSVVSTNASNVIDSEITLSGTSVTTTPLHSLDIVLASDTGSSAADRITSNPAVNGTGQAYTLVTIKEGGTTLGTTMANATGAWSFTPPVLADGAHTLTATQTDLAGNTGTTTLSFTLDITAPLQRLFTLPESGVPTEFINIMSRANKLIGTVGNDFLDGKGGRDKLIGNAGDDTYAVRNSGDRVKENPGEGVDTVQSYIASYTLPANVENLVLKGTLAQTGTGNELNNRLVSNDFGSTLNGSTGDDILVAGRGPDILTGGPGQDIFVFKSVPSSAGHITDFTSGQDMLDFRDLFAGAGYSGSDPVRDHVLVLTNNSAGGTDISFDADGWGPGSPVPVTTVDHILASSLHAQVDWWYS